MTAITQSHTYECLRNDIRLRIYFKYTRIEDKNDRDAPQYEMYYEFQRVPNERRFINRTEVDIRPVFDDNGNKIREDRVEVEKEIQTDLRYVNCVSYGIPIDPSLSQEERRRLPESQDAHGILGRKLKYEDITPYIKRALRIEAYPYREPNSQQGEAKSTQQYNREVNEMNKVLAEIMNIQ
jgi:hypothetical protein